MPGINSAYTCKKVSFIEFREAMGEAAMLASSPAATEVLANINNATNTRANDSAAEQAKVGYFVAINGDDDAVGLLVMLKQGEVWIIEDLFAGESGSGLGSTLATFGMNYAIKDYGNASNCQIGLISLDSASRRFWEKMGFTMSAPQSGGHGYMVYRVPNSRSVSPAAAT